MNSVISNIPILKSQRFTPSGCKDKGLRKFEFVAKPSLIKIKNLNLKIRKINLKRKT